MSELGESRAFQNSVSGEDKFPCCPTECDAGGCSSLGLRPEVRAKYLQLKKYIYNQVGGDLIMKLF